jgi:hypothetical protein
MDGDARGGAALSVREVSGQWNGWGWLGTHMALHELPCLRRSPVLYTMPVLGGNDSNNPALVLTAHQLGYHARSFLHAPGVRQAHQVCGRG